MNQALHCSRYMVERGKTFTTFTEVVVTKLFMFLSFQWSQKQPTLADKA